jgi:protein-tyrosine-phosphatase
MGTTTSDQDHVGIRQATDRLLDQFEDRIDAETIERVIASSVETITALPNRESVVKAVERFAHDRLHALVRLSESTAVKPAVLFLCIHNSGRSQMAAAWMRHLAGPAVDVFSGGSNPGSAVNPAAVAVMAEKGIDIGDQIPLPWSDEIVEAIDVVVTMGCGDACPVLPGKRYVDWELEDPAGRPIEDVRPIRDDIEQRVRQLMRELDLPLA